MTLSDYTSVLHPKVAGAWALHRALSTASPNPLDFFILLSSASGIVGVRGQAAYAAASTFLDAFARHLRAVHGVPATSLDLAAVRGVGYIAENADTIRTQDILRNIGHAGESLDEADVLALVAAAVAGAMDVDLQCITGLGSGDVMDPKFAMLPRRPVQPEPSSGLPSLAVVLRRARSVEEVRSAVADAIRAKVADICRADVILRADDDITDVVLDSLTIIELRSWLKRELQISVKILSIKNILKLVI